MAEHATQATPNENRNPTILDLPVTSYDTIFEFLDAADLRSCRAVCTKWYTLSTKSYREHTAHFIEGIRRSWTHKRILKENVEKILKMKKYEDSQAPVLKLMLKDVDIGVLYNLLPQTPDFKATINNINHLQLSNVMFKNCEILVEFVSQFINLEHLSMDHSHPSTSRSGFNNSLKLNCFEGIDKPGKVFPPKLNSLHLVIRDDCYNLLDLISVISLRIKTIIELRLTVIPSRRSSLTQCVIFGRWDVFRLMNIVMKNVYYIRLFLSQMIEKHAKTMKCLHINWGSNDCMLDKPVVIESLTRYQVWSLAHHIDICTMFAKFDDWPDLALKDFALNLETADELLSNVIAYYVAPFLHNQVKKGLRRIFLGRIEWAADVRSTQVVPNFFTYWWNEDPQVVEELQLTCSENVMLTTMKSDADYILITMALSLSYITDVVFKIKMCSPWVTEGYEDGLPPVEEFAEWLPLCEPVDNQPRVQFSQLTSLQIYCEDNTIKSFSIPTICMLCPALTVLKIVDGHGISDSKPKSFYQNYAGMSRSTISDCDFLFIFAKLKKLQSLTLWGNLSRLSDFGIIGERLLEKGETIVAQHYFNYVKAELTTVLQQEIMMDPSSSEYADAQLCIPSSTNHLQDLKLLSLRGVGKYVTNAITASTSRLCQMPKLKTLEIVGDHSITPQGNRALNQFITKTTIVKITGWDRRRARRGSFLLPVNRLWTERTDESLGRLCPTTVEVDGYSCDVPRAVPLVLSFILTCSLIYCHVLH